MKKFLVKVPCTYLGTGEQSVFVVVIEAEDKDEAEEKGELLAIFDYENEGYDVGAAVAELIG